MTTDETKAKDSAWYAMIAIWSSIEITDFNIYNKLKLNDDDHAFINPVNLGAKNLSIINAYFKMYGTVMTAFTTLNFYSKNVYIDTENLVGGYVFVTSCDVNTDVVKGEVYIDQLTLEGPRVTLFKYGGVYLTGPQNFTITNSFFGSYGFMFDAK